MAKKRAGTKSALNNSKPKVEVSVWTPLFDKKEEEKKEEIAVSDDTLKEIKDVMSEHLYNKGEEANQTEEDDVWQKVFVTKDVPLAKRAEKPSAKIKLTKEEKKAKKEAKKAEYKKTTFKHKLKVMAVLSVLGIFTGSGLGVWYFNFNLKSNVDYSQAGNPEDYIQSIDETLTRNFAGFNLADKANWVDYAQTAGKTPADLSPVDNFVLAQYNIQNANSYTVIGEGSVVAKTIITVDQFLYSEKKFDGERYSFVSISPDTTGIVGDVAVCDVLTKGGNSIASYKGNIHDGNRSADWTYNTSYSSAEHGNLNGVKVNDIQPYLICTETVVSSSEITIDENGNYVFTLELDTIKAVLNYIKQVQRTGGLSTYPEFKSLQTTFTITPDWQLVKMHIVEVYTAVKVGMRPTITGTLDFDFTINQPVQLPTLPEVA